MFNIIIYVVGAASRRRFENIEQSNVRLKIQKIEETCKKQKSEQIQSKPKLNSGQKSLEDFIGIFLLIFSSFPTLLFIYIIDPWHCVLLYHDFRL